MCIALTLLKAPGVTGVLKSSVPKLYACGHHLQSPGFSPSQALSARASFVFAAMGKQQAIQTTTLEPEKVKALEHVTLTEIDVPKPGPGEVLVKMLIRPVNPTDIAQAR